MSESTAGEDQKREGAGESPADEQQQSWLSRIVAFLVRLFTTARRRRGPGTVEVDRTDISVQPYSRFPDLDDYDRDTHGWRDAYIDPPKGYAVAVSACAGIENHFHEDFVERTIDEIERERRHEPRPGDGTQMPGDQPPRDNVDDRTAVPDDIVAWHWTITDDDGNEVATASRGHDLGPAACGASLSVPDLGRYNVDLRVELEDGHETGQTSFTLRNYLIVSVGDSFASGEGNPDEPVGDSFASEEGTPDEPSRSTSEGDGGDPVWLDPRGNRSLRSGPALAADAFEDAPGGELVTFLSFADTGAEIDKGLLRDQHTTGGGGPPGDGDTDRKRKFSRGDESFGGQLDQVDRTVGDRTIDALIISAGGNDVGFGDGLKELAFKIWKDPSSTVSETEESISKLVEDYENRQGDRVEAKYDRLADRIDSLEADVENVLITEYPIGLFDAEDDGAVGGGCGIFSAITEDVARAVKGLGRQLNRAVEEGADRHGWTYVDGIVEGFEGHGYCRSSKNRYFVTASESWDKQGDPWGVMHPNAKGHGVYRDRILDALERTVGDGSAADDDATDRREDQRDESSDGGGAGGDNDGGTGDDHEGGTGAPGGDGSVDDGNIDDGGKRRL